MDEIWKPVVGFPEYDVSDEGRVRSYFKRLPGAGKWELAEYPSRILKPHFGVRARVHLRRGGQGCVRQISRLVAAAFLGDCPDGMVVCHNDDNPHNNRLDNLRYDTPLSNSHEGKVTKIKNDQVVEIRRAAAQGATDEELASIYNVSLRTISGIRLGHERSDAGGPRTRRLHPGLKLSQKDVDAIIQNVGAGQTQASQARLFGVSYSEISLIVNGKREKAKRP
jgi:hypothetical protein